MKKKLLLLLLFTCGISWAADLEERVLNEIKALNRIPEEQLDERADPTLTILRTLIDLDGPEFLTIRKLCGKADIRSRLNPGSRAILASLLSPRWDAYSIAGSLWLNALRTVNPDLRDKARRKMVQFVQPVHIPELIQLLKVPNAQQPAYEILREVTKQPFPPNPAVWGAWWNKYKAKVDVVGVLLKDTKQQLAQHPITSFTQDRLWYTPDGVRDKAMPLEKRTPEEMELIERWNSWAKSILQQFTGDWSQAKPILERVTHHPDPRVNKLLEALLEDPGYGDYAAIVLAWRQSAGSRTALRKSYTQSPTVGRALALGSLGDTTSLVNLLQMIDHASDRPLSYGVMEDDLRALLPQVKGVGVLPAEEAFELLCHRSFGLATAETSKEKRKRFEKAKDWLKKNAEHLTFDARRGYFTAD